MNSMYQGILAGLCILIRFTADSLLLLKIAVDKNHLKMKSFCANVS